MEEEKKAIEELKASLLLKVKSNFKFNKDIKIKDLDISYLEFIMVLVDIEDRTKIEFKNEEVLNIKTLGDVVDLLVDKL